MCLTYLSQVWLLHPNFIGEDLLSIFALVLFPCHHKWNKNLIWWNFMCLHHLLRHLNRGLQGWCACTYLFIYKYRLGLLSFSIDCFYDSVSFPELFLCSFKVWLRKAYRPIFAFFAWIPCYGRHRGGSSVITQKWMFCCSCLESHIARKANLMTEAKTLVKNTSYIWNPGFMS